MSFGLEKRYKKRIDAFILQYPFTFFVYGSRAQGTAKDTSDLDLCVMGDVPFTTLASLREGLNNLMLPFTVDVVAWKRLSDEFKEIIKGDLKAYNPDSFLGAQVRDLSYPISAQTPAWPGRTFDVQVDMDFPDLFRVQTYTFSAGIGTHIDAPLHMISGGQSIEMIDIRTLCAPCSIFVVQQDVDSSFVLTKTMLQEYEEAVGPLAPDSWFLLMTGWGKRAHDETLYHNRDANGVMRFPKIAESAADYLIERNILGIGVDTLSPDGDDMTFPVHKKLLAAGKYIIENIMYINVSMSSRYSLQVVPLALVGGTESPARVLLVNQC